MLRKGFLAVAIILCVLSIGMAAFSAMSGNSSSNPELSGTDETLQGRLMWLFKHSNGKALKPGALTDLINDAEDLIVPVGSQQITYGLNRIFEFYDTNPGIPLCVPRNSIDRNLFALAKKFPIECLRIIDEKNIYAVYKTVADDDSINYAYIFFQAENKADGEAWIQQNPILLASKPLQYKDFASVVPGTPASDVQKIDPVTKFYIDGVIKPNFGEARESIHLTQDGILTISYILDNGDFIVNRISRTSGYHFVSGDLIKIPPKDLPSFDNTAKY